jgi:hypothetical protein
MDTDKHGWRSAFPVLFIRVYLWVSLHPKIRSSNEDFHRKGAEVAEGTLRRVCVSGYCRAFFTAIPFHPLGEPSSSIVFPKFLSSHMQGSAFLCDLCASAVKN